MTIILWWDFKVIFSVWKFMWHTRSTVHVVLCYVYTEEDHQWRWSSTGVRSRWCYFWYLLCLPMCSDLRYSYTHTVSLHPPPLHLFHDYTYYMYVQSVHIVRYVWFLKCRSSVLASNSGMRHIWTDPRLFWLYFGIFCVVRRFLSVEPRRPVIYLVILWSTVYYDYTHMCPTTPSGLLPIHILLVKSLTNRPHHYKVVSGLLAPPERFSSTLPVRSVSRIVKLSGN